MTAKSSKSKRIIATLVAASFVLPNLPLAEIGALTANAVGVAQAALASENGVSEGLEFTSNGDGTCYVSGIGDFTGTNLVIPSTSPDGDSVTSIGDSAFRECTSLASITIPDSVTSIGERAFEVCTSLASIKIPDSVTEIGGCAFYDCTSLASITIPDSVTLIGELAFSGCTSLESITVSKDNSVYHSAGDCLIETKSKTLIRGCKNSVIPDDGSVTEIGDWAFYGCTSLESITIPDSVTSIGREAFSSCTGLESITIGDSVTLIGNSAFSSCTSLESIMIGDSVTSIGWGAFYGCTSLESITLPDSVTYTGLYAFVFCTSLARITFLNPKCDINYSEISTTTTICGYANSTAEAYAQDYGNPFEKIALPGDVDGNDVFDLLDVLLMQQSLAGWDVELDSDAGDVNDDGETNLLDVLLMQQSLAGWDVVLK